MYAHICKAFALRLALMLSYNYTNNKLFLIHHQIIIIQIKYLHFENNIKDDQEEEEEDDAASGAGGRRKRKMYRDFNCDAKTRLIST